jgi:hypothetical protein
MLVERMKKARALLLKKQDMDVLQRVVDWHKDAAGKLQELGEAMHALAQTASCLRERNILASPLGNRPFTALRREFGLAENAIRESGDALPSVNLTPLVERSKGASSTAQQVLREAWQAYLDRTGATPAGEEVMKRLRQIGLAPVADALDQASRVLRHARSTLPSKAAQIDAVGAAHAAVEQAWTTANITPEMVPQVTVMTGAGLPLSEASDDLLRWLRERKLDGQVRMRLG